MKKTRGIFTLLASTLFINAANAALIVNGSQDVDSDSVAEWHAASLDDPLTNNPLTYTPQEATALLFGGDPGDYSIPVADSGININKSVWSALQQYARDGITVTVDQLLVK